MTLIICFPVRDGIVMAADSQLTIANARQITHDKIKRLGTQESPIIWGAAGPESFIQRVEEEVQGIPHLEERLEEDDNLLQLKEDIAGAIRRSVILSYEQSPLSEDMDIDEYLEDIEGMGQFIFATWNEGPIVYFFDESCQPVRTQGPVAIGSGEDFAYALLARYEHSQLELTSGLSLVHSVMKDSIKVASQDLCEPVNMWTIGKQADKSVSIQLSDKQAKEVEDRARVLAEKQLEIFYRFKD